MEESHMCCSECPPFELKNWSASHGERTILRENIWDDNIIVVQCGNSTCFLLLSKCLASKAVKWGVHLVCRILISPPSFRAKSSVCLAKMACYLFTILFCNFSVWEWTCPFRHFLDNNYAIISVQVIPQIEVVQCILYCFILYDNTGLS